MSVWFRAHTMRFGLAGLSLGVFLVMAAVILSGAGEVAAAPQLQDPTPSNETCLFCHQEQGITAEIGGQHLPITIDGTKYEASVHGMEDLACVDCDRAKLEATILESMKDYMKKGGVHAQRLTQ